MLKFIHNGEKLSPEIDWMVFSYHLSLELYPIANNKSLIKEIKCLDSLAKEKYCHQTSIQRWIHSFLLLFLSNDKVWNIFIKFVLPLWTHFDFPVWMMHLSQCNPWIEVLRWDRVRCFCLKCCCSGNNDQCDAQTLISFFLIWMQRFFFLWSIHGFLPLNWCLFGNLNWDIDKVRKSSKKTYFKYNKHEFYG